MTSFDMIGAPVPGLRDAIDAAAAADTVALESLPWFPFTVLASRGCRPAAVRIARRAERAYWVLRQALDTTPRLRLVVLDRAAWPAGPDAPDYGVMHVNADGDLVVGASPALAWTGISAWLAEHLDARTLAGLIRVHGRDLRTRGPALNEIADALIAHEIGHVIASQAGARFPRRWLAEAFANYAMIAVLGETDPIGLRRLGALAEAAETVAHHLPRQDEFESGDGLDIMPSVLAQLALTRGAYDAYAAAQAVPLLRLLRLFREPVTAGAARLVPASPSDAELERLLAVHVHPSVAAIPQRLPVAPQRAAA
jgi:hypothetical protein